MRMRSGHCCHVSAAMLMSMLLLTAILSPQATTSMSFIAAPAITPPRGSLLTGSRYSRHHRLGQWQLEMGSSSRCRRSKFGVAHGRERQSVMRAMPPSSSTSGHRGNKHEHKHGENDVSDGGDSSSLCPGEANKSSDSDSSDDGNTSFSYFTASGTSTNNNDDFPSPIVSANGSTTSSTVQDGMPILESDASTDPPKSRNDTILTDDYTNQRMAPLRTPPANSTEDSSGRIPFQSEAQYQSSQQEEQQLVPPDAAAETTTTSSTSTSASASAAEAEEDALSIPPDAIEILPLTFYPEDYMYEQQQVELPQQQLQQDDTTSEPSNNEFQPAQMQMYPFVNMFRGAAMYIARHRNAVMVYHISGELLEWPGFDNLINDVALTWLLGTRVIIVVGCRCFVDRRLQEMGCWPPERHGGVRVTDDASLRIVKEEAGFVRFEVERQLARALRQGSYFVGTGPAEQLPNVVSGNFYSAQPFGVVDGVDHQYTGILRRVEVDKIRQAHLSNDIVLLTNLGVSPSGELFNVNSESLASGVAGAVKANKIIFFALAGTELRDMYSEKQIQSLRQSDAKRLLDYNGVTVRRGGYAVIDADTEHHPAVIERLLKIGWSLMALQNGVKRAHIIPPVNGALLQELFTRDGAGTLISRDIYEGIRRATVNDVAGIYDLIQQLVDMGTLVPRSRTALEQDILSYFVYTRDNLIVACGQLHRFEAGYAEIGCLVVNKHYRSQGRGDAMLGYLERLCVQSGIPNVFVLSTHTMQFYVERGFREVGVESLPTSRRAKYNHARRSKIYMKRIDDDRDLDADELLWDR